MKRSACLPACLLLLMAADAAGHDDEFERCFSSQEHFGCYTAGGWCSEESDGAVRGFPVVQLDKDPFVSVSDPLWRGWSYGLAEENPDADADGLWDDSELELAQRLRLWVLNAWQADWWSDDPHYGEPTVLFQVHPEVPSWCSWGACGPNERRIVLRFVLLWDRDGGYRTCEPWTHGAMTIGATTSHTTCT
ncbi:MAG: hypothetical protein HY905_08680 [Deltaproteobacteria bacterium]|nr:hypothetical protein [Deltaproteobacteria bacterium]